MSALLSQRAYARHRGVTHRAVQKAIAAGRIPLAEGGKVDPEAADRAWAANTDESKPRNSVSGTPRPAVVVATPRPQPAQAPANGAPTGYQAARTLHETYRAKTARIEFERLTGTLISVDDVKVEAFTVARRVREAILSLPDRLAPVLAAMDEPADIHRTLTAELRQALEALSHDQRA